jgi:hypothetical protein
MKDEGNKDFWVGVGVGVGLGLLGYYMFTQIKPANAAPALPTMPSGSATGSATTHSITMDGSTFSVTVAVGDTVILVPVQGATLQSVTNSNPLFFNGDITVAPFSAVVSQSGNAGANAIGQATLTVLDSAGKTTALTVVAS